MAVSRLLQYEFDRLAAENLWVPVESSNLEAVAYVRGGTGNLWVRFHKKPGARFTVYMYQYVEPRVYEGLIAAPSKGKYFHAKIRNQYATYQIA